MQLLHRIQMIVRTYKKVHKELRNKHSKEENKDEKASGQLKSFGK